MPVWHCQSACEALYTAYAGTDAPPEGHRAEDGRLQEFKKGFAHLAAQTGLPVVPVIVTGAHKALPAGGSLKTGRRGVLVRVVVKPAIDTSGWSSKEWEASYQLTSALAPLEATQAAD